LSWTHYYINLNLPNFLSSVTYNDDNDTGLRCVSSLESYMNGNLQQDFSGARALFYQGVGASGLARLFAQGQSVVLSGAE